MTDLASRALSSFLHELGGISLFYMRIFRTMFATRGNLKPVMEQIAYVCLRSLSTVVFAGVFVGAILVIQFNLMLRQYDAQIFLGGLNTSAVVREIGPLIISFMLAGKIGAFTAAELGNMRVTEQIDAIRCLGTNPFQYLVLPRFTAIIVSSGLLLGIGLIVSIIGSTAIAGIFCGINPLQYASSLSRFTGVWTVFCGMVKSIVYGFIVAGVSCYKGYNASGGARGVGKAVTLAAVYTNLYIVVADFVTSNILEFLSEFIRAVTGAF
jgi:phospholipid/cholesterol/gamma-HCH transport system permease protein